MNYQGFKAMQRWQLMGRLFLQAVLLMGLIGFIFHLWWLVVGSVILLAGIICGRAYEVTKAHISQKYKDQ